MNNWLMIVNPSSASSTNDKWKDCEKVLSDGGIPVDKAFTQHAGHAIDLAREGAEKGYRRFIAVGGDGTLHEVMSGLVRWADATGGDLGDCTLAVIPAGTGNDWIRTAGIPEDLAEAARCIVQGHTAKEDVVRLTFQNGVFCMANIGGIGVDAAICINTNTLKDKGYKGGILYKMVAPYSVFARKRNSVEVICDGETVHKGPMFTIVMGNGIYRGGGLKQTQDGASWSDGQLEVSIQTGVNHFKALSQMMHVFSGDFAVLPGIITKRFRKMTVKPLGGTPDPVEVDGEIPGSLPVTVELTGQQINIIVP